jgi:hypothetical protein
MRRHAAYHLQQSNKRFANNTGYGNEQCGGGQSTLVVRDVSGDPVQDTLLSSPGGNAVTSCVCPGRIATRYDKLIASFAAFVLQHNLRPPDVLLQAVAVGHHRLKPAAVGGTQSNVRSLHS